MENLKILKNQLLFGYSDQLGLYMRLFPGHKNFRIQNLAAPAFIINKINLNCY